MAQMHHIASWHFRSWTPPAARSGRCSARNRVRIIGRAVKLISAHPAVYGRPDAARKLPVPSIDGCPVEEPPFELFFLDVPRKSRQCTGYGRKRLDGHVMATVFLTLACEASSCLGSALQMAWMKYWCHSARIVLDSSSVLGISFRLAVTGRPPHFDTARVMRWTQPTAMPAPR